MNKSILLERIQGAKTRNDEITRNRYLKRQAYKENLRQQIKNLIPRICDFWDLVECLNASKISNWEFTTDGILHRVGFFTYDKNDPYFYGPFLYCKPLRLFGVKGGGCDGGDLCIDLDSLQIYYTGAFEKSDFNEVEHMEKIIKEFDNYEKKLTGYIENLPL